MQGTHTRAYSPCASDPGERPFCSDDAWRGGGELVPKGDAPLPRLTWRVSHSPLSPKPGSSFLEGLQDSTWLLSCVGGRALIRCETGSCLIQDFDGVELGRLWNLKESCCVYLTSYQEISKILKVSRSNKKNK